MADFKQVKIDVDYNYKSVIVSEGMENTFDFLNSLPKFHKDGLIKLLEDNKDSLTFIPAKIDEGLYICIYKTFYKDTPQFTLYVFEKKEDMLDLLDRKPLNIDVEDDIKEGIRNL